MLGSVGICIVVTAEISLVAYQAHKAGVFKDIKNKFTKQVCDTADYVVQPTLRRLSWK